MIKCTNYGRDTVGKGAQMLLAQILGGPFFPTPETSSRFLIFVMRPPLFIKTFFMFSNMKMHKMFYSTSGATSLPHRWRLGQCWSTAESPLQHLPRFCSVRLKWCQPLSARFLAALASWKDSVRLSLASAKPLSAWSASAIIRKKSCKCNRRASSET